MDRDDTGQASQDVAQDEAEASVAQERDSESSVMNRAIRGFGRVVSGLFRDEDDSAGADEEQAKPEATAQEQPETPDQLRERIRREEQSRKDTEIRDFRRDFAVQRAESGDLSGLVELAERYGDAGFAKQELARRGAVYEAGEITVKETEAQATTEQHTKLGESIAASLIPEFDRALLEPVLNAVPEAEYGRIRDLATDLDGRTKAVTEGIAAIKAAAEQGAATKLLSDEKFVTRMLKTEGFRRALITDPVANKQLRAHFRGELDEADLNPGVGQGGGLETESSVMNAHIRGLAGVADERAPRERAAGAGASRRSQTNRDLLADDE